MRIHLILSILFFVCEAADRPPAQQQQQQQQRSDRFDVLIHGDKVKGFLKFNRVSPTHYTLTFDVRGAQPRNGLQFALHASIAPYDGKRTHLENCRRVKKSPRLLRQESLSSVTVSAEMLVGHTVIIEDGSNGDPLACATIIPPGTELQRVSVHSATIDGRVHFARIGNKIRLLPDLDYAARYEAGTPDSEQLGWAFVSQCDGTAVPQTNGDTELGVDGRTTVTVELPPSVDSIAHFELFHAGKSVGCSALTTPERRSVRVVAANENDRTPNWRLQQDSYFEVVKAAGDRLPEVMQIQDDCLDRATESRYPRVFDRYYATMSLYGRESVAFKSVRDGEQCAPLLAQWGAPTGYATFRQSRLQPISGHVSLVDTDEVVLITGQLRDHSQDYATRATVEVSPHPLVGDSCPEYVEQCPECFSLPDSALVVGRNESSVYLSGALAHFDTSAMRSVVIDLLTYKICANLTHLPTGALSAAAELRRRGPATSKTMATVVVLDYPANKFSEIVVHRESSDLKDVRAHERPVDGSTTVGHPCSESTIGPPFTPDWFVALKSAFSASNDEDILLSTEGRLIGDPDHSVLGTSLLLKDGHDVLCGSFFGFDSGRQIVTAIARFRSSGAVKGFVRWAQNQQHDDVATSSPTLMTSELSSTKPLPGGNMEQVEWRVVDANSSESCEANSTMEDAQSPPSLSGNLTLYTRTSMSIGEAHANELVGKYLQLKSTDGRLSCAIIERASIVPLRWLVHSNRSLVELQEKMATRLEIDHNQVSIEYTRKLIGGHCSLYDVFVTVTKSAKLDELFSLERQGFVDDEPMDCGGLIEQTTLAPAPKEAVTSAKPSSATTPHKYAMHIVALLVTILIWGL